jgi:hypothetical protein
MVVTLRKHCSPHLLDMLGRLLPPERLALATLTDLPLLLLRHDVAAMRFRHAGPPLLVEPTA